MGDSRLNTLLATARITQYYQGSFESNGKIVARPHYYTYLAPTPVVAHK